MESFLLLLLLLLFTGKERGEARGKEGGNQRGMLGGLLCVGFFPRRNYANSVYNQSWIVL